MMRRGTAAPAALIVFILFVVVVLSAVPSPVLAQAAAPTIQTADLKLWPEYDDPGVLVIFSGDFTPATKFPLQVAFPIPAGARNIQATYRDANNALITRPYEMKDGKLTYELPSAGFHVEFYVDRTPSGQQRSIDYAFEAPYAIDALNVSVQEPARATGFTMTPAGQTTQTGADNLTDHLFTQQKLAAGQKLDINVGYTKADTGLSAPQLAVAATAAPAQAGAAAAAAAPAAASSSNNLLPWLLIGLGVALLGGVLVYWLLTQRRRAAPAQVPAPKSRPVAAAPAGTTRSPTPSARPSGAVSFCTNCGHALKAEDRFCSQCGAPRRS